MKATTVGTFGSGSESSDAALDDFDPEVRHEALRRLVAEVDWPAPRTAVNLHCHTFYSYNAYGYSPTHFGVLARRLGLAVAGIVDFDVLDGLDEFQAASHLLGLKGVVSLESRVFVPEFADLVINSPGEPGIAYHMGVGFPHASHDPFLAEMRTVSHRRLQDMLARVNSFMRPLQLDFDTDVLPLTPNGNATERHVCVAFERQACSMFPDARRRASFWSEKLGASPPEGAELQSLIRLKTLKQGGVGYVRPDQGAFPAMADMNRFVMNGGAIPTLAWLDGTSEGEQDLERLLAVACTTGVAAINIIPDQNYTLTPGASNSKLQNLHRVIEMAVKGDLPVVVGTEMNTPGQRVVDDFSAPYMRALAPVFVRGAHIVYAHSVLQPCGFGYLSEWAAATFESAREKNVFFENAGRDIAPACEEMRDLPPDASPEQILARVRASKS